MPHFPSMTETITFPVWVLAAGLAAFAVFALISVLRSGLGRTAGSFVQAAAAVLLLALGWFYLDHLQQQQGEDEKRRAIEARLLALNAQALAPDSNLACLDPGADDVVEVACEKALYASPERVATALAYMGARIDLMREIAALPGRGEAAYDSIRTSLIKGLAADRYGLIAQVLQGRDGCTAERCDAFEWLVSRDQIVANMRERAYHARVVRYSAAWGEKSAVPALAAHPVGMPGNPTNINFPSSTSIPPVSIMSNEPGMPGQNGVDAAVKPDARQGQPPTPPRRPQKAAPRPPGQQATGAPVPIVPQ